MMMPSEKPNTKSMNENPIKSTSQQRAITELIIGAVAWETETQGYCTCPGEPSHKDCKVFLDKVPTVFCFHTTSCKPQVDATNLALRRVLSGGCGTRPPLTAAQRREWQRRDAEKRKKMEMAASATRGLPIVLDVWKTSVDLMRKRSPSPIPSNPVEHFHALLSLFPSEDVIWVGDTYSSCSDDATEYEKVRCRGFFRTVGEWSKLSAAPANFTCPSVFKTGSHSRSQANALFRCFLVVESDVHSKDEMCAILEWLQKWMRLRAVVDTGGKSLHGWFEPPQPTALTEFEIILPAMKLDPALFRISQPCRMPGAMRDGKYQHLVYLDKGVRHAC